MQSLPEITSIAQSGIAVVFIWLFWQAWLKLNACYEARVAEQKNMVDTLIALMICDDSDLSEPQRALKRQLDRYRPSLINQSPSPVKP